MTIPTHFRRLFLFLVLLGLGLNLNADVIDPYTASQGPFTVGPNETISDEDGLVLTASALGGFRFAAPGMGDDAAAGSTAKLDINGGVFKCTVDYPSVDPVNHFGGCSGAYDRGDGPTFDLSGSTGFVFDVQSVETGMNLGVVLVDTNKVASIGNVEVLTAGQVTIGFDELFSTAFPDSVDLTLIDNIAMNISNLQGQEGSITLGEFSTDGPINEGPAPPNEADEIVAVEIPGNYFNPFRDGEGCQLTLERDGVTFILTCYFYQDGEQFWLIGVGLLANGQIIFHDMTITTGADYGIDFDPTDVVRTSWGSVIMTWDNCNNAELELLPVLMGFEQLTLQLTHIIPTVCGGGGAQGHSLPWMGAFYKLERDGEGFQLAAEGDGSVFVMTWYTYLDGKQVWMIGAGAPDGNQIVFEPMIITSGANFGSEFNKADVVRRTFGKITADFSDCNNFTATVDSDLPEFSDIVLDVEKIVPGPCP
jgi:hypothetical protein